MKFLLELLLCYMLAVNNINDAMSRPRIACIDLMVAFSLLTHVVIMLLKINELLYLDVVLISDMTCLPLVEP